MDPAWGGPVEGVSNFTRQAQRRGHHAEVVCADHPTAPWLKSAPVKVNAVGPGRYGHYGYTHRLDEWLEANASRFDAIVVNGIWMYFSTAARRAALRAGVPYFLFVHGALDPWFARHYPHKQVKKTVYWLMFEHKVLRDAEAVLFTTMEEKEVSHGAFWPYRCNAKVTGYGVSDPLPEQEAQADEQQARLQVEQIAPDLQGRPFILFLARLHEKKGIDLLLKAIANNRRDFGNRRIVIAGPGDPAYVAQLKAKAAELHVNDLTIWSGPLYGNAKWAAVRSAEAYILPSHQENFGISVAEALACGVPVLITDRVNIWREIQAEKAGFVDTDDVEGVTRLLARWCSLGPAEAKSLRETARHCFLHNFDIAKVSGQFFDQVQAAVEERAGVVCAS
jgi:glycosyltransferase involved in cell wall biosynthesis